MQNIFHFYNQLTQLLQQESIVLATVIDGKGSVPREAGAKMIICAEEKIFDTIGGGAGEAKVIAQAIEVLQTGEKQIVEIDLTGAPQRETQGICGGRMRVWLEHWSGQEAIALAQQIITRLQSGRSATLITPLNQTQFPYLAEITDSLPADAFVETLQPPPTLLIIGAGHVGEQLAKVADLIGFQVVIQDDRPEWANPQRYPQATQIYTEPIAQAIHQFTHYNQLYAALVTRGYKYDLDALTALLKRDIPCAYIGMIGSQKRVRQVYQAIEPQFQPKLKSIYAPIGLDIGALTPEEIAVSIAAELILVRRGGTGRSLSEGYHLSSLT